MNQKINFLDLEIWYEEKRLKTKTFSKQWTGTAICP